MNIRSTAFIAVIAVAASLAGCAGVQEKLQSASTTGEQQRAQKESALSHCPAIVGAAAIMEPQRNWWQAMHLDSPEALLKVYALQSGCFTVVDRGRGFEAAQRERELAASGELRTGANMGKGQIKVADFLVTPDIVTSNNNASGMAAGAILGAFIPVPGLAAIASNINLTTKTANVTLTVTDARTLEEIAIVQGHAEKTDLGFGAAGLGIGAGVLAGAGAGSYANTAQGQVAALAYIDAFNKMVTKLEERKAKLVTANAQPVQPVMQKVAAAARPTLTMAKADGHLYYGPNVRSGQIKLVPPGTVLYPTGAKANGWLEVTNEKGDERGWVYGTYTTAQK